MFYNLLSAAVHATNLDKPLTSQTCLKIIELSEYFETVSLYSSTAEYYSCYRYTRHYSTVQNYVNVT